MEYSESCVVQDSIFVLSTLNPARSSYLREIALEVGCAANRLFWEGEHAEDKRMKWKELDDILSTLAKASVDLRGSRLAFALVLLKSREDGRLVSVARRRLLKLLPRFDELGSLHVYYGWGNRS